MYSTKIILELLKKYWKLILMVLMVIVIIILYNTNENNKAKADRFENNYANSVLENNKQKDTYLTLSEFREYQGSLIDTISSRLEGIKIKNIQEITKITNNYTDSSKHIYEAKETTKGVFDISYKEKCWGFTGLYYIDSNKVSISNRYYNDSIFIVDYFKRRRLFNVKKILPRIGKKEYFRETFSKCNSTSNVEKIIIEGKKDERKN